jgi:hypothetical protein
MKTDAAIKRTRDARSEISASVADDPVKLVKYYIAIQKRFDARLQPGPNETWEDSYLAEQQRRDSPQKRHLRRLK